MASLASPQLPNGNTDVYPNGHTLINSNRYTNGGITADGHPDTNGNTSTSGNLPIHNNGHSNGTVNTETNGPVNHLDLDVLIVGAGFAGIYLLHQLRKEGLKAKIVEAGHGLGGVWHWNSYPGARVDTPVPTYALNIPEVYETWTWSEQYPGEKEFKAYFQHLDKVLGLSKDVIYGETVTKAAFDETTDTWRIQSDAGSTFTSQFFCPCLGFASKRYTPDWPGLVDEYKGQIVHPNLWPADGLQLEGKKVALVGTGATGLQIAQEVTPLAKELTCFVRTPNLSWPMRQRNRTEEENLKEKPQLKQLLSEKRFTTFGGFLYPETTRLVMDDTPEEREARLEQVYQDGGFKVFFVAYINILGDQEGNDKIYEFWRRKTHERMKNKAKAELLAPIKPPHPFAAKRPSLEQDYYEHMDRDHVTLVDVKQNPVTHVVSNGIVTADGTIHEADIIIMATGYDAITGGFRNIDITGLEGLTLQDKWSDGTHSYLGATISGFPNMFYAYGPLSPGSYGTGPAVVESQAEWMLKTIRKMKAQSVTRIDATIQGEQEWRQKTDTIHAYTLRDNVEGSWYLG